jgi:hypothetical protein
VAEHKLIEKRHLYIEAGSMHNAKESAKIFVSLYTKNGWLNIFVCLISRDKKKGSSTLIQYQMHFTGTVNPKRLAKIIVRKRKFFN